MDVLRFLEESPVFPSKRRAALRSDRVKDMLTNVLYAGYINLPRWDVSFVRAKHEPLIAYETFQAVQDRLNGKTRTSARANLATDFPLLGMILRRTIGQWPG